MKKKPATLSDKLNKLFAPEDHSDESGDETAPKFSEFDETPDDAGRDAALSEFRKRNVRFLEEFDRKYKGAVSSRSETFGGDEEEESDGAGDDSDDFGGDDDDDEEEDDSSVRKSKPKSLVLLKPPREDDDSEDDDDAGDNYDDEDDDDDDGEDESGGDDYEESSDEDGESSSARTARSKQQASKQPELTLLKEENRQDAINKGLAVQNQLKIWERLLEIRIKVQPCLLASNGLPPPEACEKLRSQNEEFRDKAQQAVATVTEAMDRMLELQELLMDRFAETKDLLKSGSKRTASSSKSSKSKRIALDGYEAMLAGRCKDMEEYRNSVLMKWHDRTTIASKMRSNPMQSLSVLKKIEDSLINREELVRKTQLYRGGYTLLGREVPSEAAGPTEPTDREDGRDAGEEQTPSSVYDGEIFDDSDFYHQMLRELIEYKTSTTDSPQEIASKLAELQKLRNKMKKTVDTRASKGRKIRYVVHKKLVNFMAPVPDYEWTDEAKDELFGSLFGQRPAAEER
uniref:Apoptosis antagonizing transcription factor/protein transport protein n=1 Tax=Anopheles quadriannulatus TaxID=34691 RepID=A0A182X3W1_ANOQN